MGLIDYLKGGDCLVDNKVLSTLCADLTVLYVEDEEAVREALTKQLERIFDTVLVAADGQEGLRLFSQHRPPLVISDIRMPVMDGLAMTQSIKAIDPNSLVIIATAHSDESYLLDAIDIGVDRYLLKPIDLDRLKEALYVAATTLRDRRMARELEQRQLQDQLNQSADNLTGELMRAVPIPSVLMNGDEPAYMNDAFVALLGHKRLRDFTTGALKLDDLLLAKSGYLTTLDGLDPQRENKIYLKTAEGVRIYRVFASEVAFDQERSFVLYALIDITLSEYQKIKLENYAQRLADLLIRRQHTPAAQTSGTKAAATPLLSLEEEAHLRRSHMDKTDAATYVAGLDDDVRELLDELRETEAELADLIAECEGADLAAFKAIGDRLSHYARAIGRLFEFEGLAYAIGSLAALLGELHQKELEGNKGQKLLRYLESIRMDLSTWRHTIFAQKNTVDIHYLDSSLLSSALQAQLAIRGGESGEEELELF